MGQPDYRVYEMNRRLQQWTEVFYCVMCSSNDFIQTAFCGIVVILVG